MASHDLDITVELGKEEQERLLAALRCEAADLVEHLERLARAAVEEWLDQILARRLPARIKDVREVRLLHFALAVNGGKLPRPEQIADLFHLTAPEARTLHRNTRTRYSFELAQGVVAALGDALDDAVWVAASGGEKGYVRVHMDQALFEFAELQLSWGTDEPAARITRDGNYDEYKVPLSSLRLLCKKAGKDDEAVKRAAERRAKEAK